MRTTLLFWVLLSASLGAACGKRGMSPSPSPADPSRMNEPAPAVFKTQFTTTKGDFVVEVQRAWAPHGADRFYNLVRVGFFDGVKFFRTIKGFMVQFGINGDPAVSRAWKDSDIPDDPVKQSNTRGQVTFATAGPGTRTTQIFINLVDNKRLDGSGFAPFGRVISGMEVIDALYGGYGEGPPAGQGPDQDRIEAEGTAYLEKDFPLLDAVKTARIVP